MDQGVSGHRITPFLLRLLQDATQYGREGSTTLPAPGASNFSVGNQEDSDAFPLGNNPRGGARSNI